MRKFILQAPDSQTTVYDKSIIIVGGRQFTIYDTYYIEEKINITNGYMWFIQYDNYNKISLNNFRHFMSTSSIGSFNFKETLTYIGVSLSTIPQDSF